jgi:hypothetical protein
LPLSLFCCHRKILRRFFSVEKKTEEQQWHLL